MAPLVVNLAESFTIVSWNYCRCSHRLLSTKYPLPHCSLPHTHGICISLSAYTHWLCGKDTQEEYKLAVVAFYRENNLYRTSKKFDLNTKTFLWWAASKKEISNAESTALNTESQTTWKCSFSDGTRE